MAQVAKERAAALRKTLKEEMLQRRPSFSDAEAFVLRGLLLDTPKEDSIEATVDPADNHAEKYTRELSDEILFSLPTEAEFSNQKAELPSHHKPAKRRSTLGLWKAFEFGFSPNILLRKAALVAGEEPLTGKEIGQCNETENTEDDEVVELDDEDEEDIASDAEVRPDAKSDGSLASSWDEDDHQDNYDTWEVRFF